VEKVSRGGIEIAEDTKVSAIFGEYGDIAEVMEVFGIKRVSGSTLRTAVRQVPGPEG
jgi:hydrogenase maturation factor HypE